MKRICLTISLLISLYSFGLSQNSVLNVNLKQSKNYHFFIPEIRNQSHFNLKFHVDKMNKPIILHSPIRHKAIFCRLEDLSQKKVGIMVQFHLGDYQSKYDMIIPR